MDNPLDGVNLGLPAKAGEAGVSQKEAREPAFYQRRKKRGNEICQLLIRSGDVVPEQVRRALKIQEEEGGLIGQILVRIGGCNEAAIARALLEQLRLQSEQGEVNLSVAARENPAIAGINVECSPFLTRFSLALVDGVALALAAGFGQLVNYVVRGRFRLDAFLVTMPVIAICVVAFGILGLYSSMAQSPPDEIRNTTKGITLMFLCGIAAALLSGRATGVWSIASVASWWLASICVVPVARAVLRAKCAHMGWWGHPVVVLGAGQAGRMLVRTLRAQPGFGLKPVVMLDDDRSKHGTLRAHLNDESIHVRSVTQASDQLVSSSLRAASDLVPESVRARWGAELAEQGPPSRRGGSDLVPESVRARWGAELAEQGPSSRRGGSDLAPESIRGRWGVDLVDQPPPSRSVRQVTIKKAPARAERPRGMFAEVEGVPVVGDFALAPVLAKRLKIPYAIVAMPGVSSQKLLQLTERVGGKFSHLLLIPDLFGFASLGVPARDVGGILGIEVRQQLLLPGPRFIKRLMDVGITLLGGIFVFPVVALLALLIKLDSRGPVFYFQERLGRDGRRFFAAKFRSMHGDGEARLKAVLESDPKLRAEYDEFHKLTNDPRITRVGRVVRRFSLDELPQLWNVLKGQMSIVGPRPYLEREIPEMEQSEGIILRAMPGLTGLWQVSDRNSTGFSARVRMDVHYVRNWSPWLDIYIVARTIGVVLKGTGV